MLETNAKTMQMVRVAELYYEQHLSQIDISEIMGISRSTVSRLLAEAHEQGIVEITIRRPVEKVARLSEMMRKQFGLRDAIVVRGGETYDEVLDHVGLATAELLQSVLRDGMILGISWGVTLYHTLQYIRKSSLKGIVVIQMMGSLGHGNPATDGPELALRFAEKLNGAYRIISAPAVVRSKDVRQDLINQPQIQSVIEQGSKAQVCLTGIGSLADEMSSLMRAGYMTAEERAMLRMKNGVGHILSRPIDVNGNEIDSEFSDRVVASPLESLRNAEWSIGCSGSPLKAPAVLGAIRGKYYNALVIDEASAREVLRLAETSELIETEVSYL
jgi:deoxyribonucleoside regulator